MKKYFIPLLFVLLGCGEHSLDDIFGESSSSVDDGGSSSSRDIDANPLPYGSLYATPARNQIFSGPCWIFTGTALLETYIKKNTGAEVIFSENHARFSIGSKLDLADGYNDGGNIIAELTTYWLRGELGGGPVLLQDDYPFGDISSTQWNPNAQRWGRVTNVQVIPNSSLTPLQDNPGNDIAYRSKIQEAIRNYGSVGVSFWWAPSLLNNSPGGISYYYNQPDEINSISNAESRINHAIQILGWNDDYPATSFTNPPPGNGAWYVKNSGKAEIQRFHWVSYYQFIQQATFVAGYESAPKGNVYDYTPQTINDAALTSGSAGPRYWANIFDCEDANAYLEEVIIRVYGNATYNIYVATGNFTGNADEDRVLLNSAFSNKAAELRVSEDEPVNKYTGYYTLKLDTPVPVGSKSFAIVVEGRTLDSTGIRYYYLPTRLNPNFISNARESYFSSSTSANKTWQDFHLRKETSDYYGNFYIYGVVIGGSNGQSDMVRVMDR